MSEERMELVMQVDGMTGERCVEAVTRVVRRLDPEAEVSVDLAHGRLSTVTSAQSLDVADALTKAGYEARGMTL